MIDTILLAVISTLLALVGTLGLLAYRDIARRMLSMEEGYTRNKAALITVGFILISKEQDHDAISRLLATLMGN